MFRAALAFFTRLPVGAAPLPATLQGAAAWLPVIGCIVGLLVALSVGISSYVLPAPLCGIIGCLVWVWVTGCLHLDGVADCGDGLLAEAPAKQRLAIMKDSRLGAFGGVTLFFTLITKTSTLMELAGTCAPNVEGLFSLIKACCMAAILARVLVFWPMHLPSARPDGIGERLQSGLTHRDKYAAAAIGLGICYLNGWCGIMALIVASAGMYLFLSAVQKRLGGVTGDVFGCSIEMTECIVLAVCCLR